MLSISSIENLKTIYSAEGKRTCNLKVSVSSIFKRTDESRAVKIYSLTIFMGLVCWTPYAVSLIMTNLSTDSDVMNFFFLNISVRENSKCINSAVTLIIIVIE